jgi:hypothetical protein
VIGRATGLIEAVVFLIPTVGFVAAAVLLVGGSELWRQVSVGSAIASLAAITLFPQQLPPGSVVGAVVVNVAVLVALLVLRWPSPEAVGA